MSKLILNGPNSVILQRAPVEIRGLLPIEPSWGSSIAAKVRVNRISFGDGYEARQPDGINSVCLKLSADYNSRSLKVITEIKKFFLGESPYSDRRPDEYFFMTAPAPYDDKVRKFILGEADVVVVPNGANNYSLRVDLKEVFDL